MFLKVMNQKYFKTLKENSMCFKEIEPKHMKIYFFITAIPPGKM